MPKQKEQDLINLLAKEIVEIKKRVGIGYTKTVMDSKLSRLDGGHFLEWLRPTNDFPTIPADNAAITAWWTTEYGSAPQDKDHIEIIWNDETKFSLFTFNAGTWTQGTVRTAHIKGGASATIPAGFIEKEISTNVFITTDKNLTGAGATWPEVRNSAVRLKVNQFGADLYLTMYFTSTLGAWTWSGAFESGAVAYVAYWKQGRDVVNYEKVEGNERNTYPILEYEIETTIKSKVLAKP